MRHREMSDVQLFWISCAECVEFLSQRRSEAVLVESRHEGQTDKEGLYQRKRSDRAPTAYTRYLLGWTASAEFLGEEKYDFVYER